MTTISAVVILSTGWFLILALVKNKLLWKFCAACVAVSSTWLVLLAAWIIGFDVDPLLIAILMGESSVGLYYLLEKKLAEEFQIFRWPYLITAATLVYALLGAREKLLPSFVWLLVIWFLFVVAYVTRNNSSFKKIAARLIACCRDW